MTAPPIAVEKQEGIGRYKMRVRWLSDKELGVTISGTEYGMRVCEANELVGLINRARHDRRAQS